MTITTKNHQTDREAIMAATVYFYFPEKCYSFSENPSVLLCSLFCFPSSLFSLSLPAEGSHSLH